MCVCVCCARVVCEYVCMVYSCIRVCNLRLRRGIQSLAPMGARDGHAYGIQYQDKIVEGPTKADRRMKHKQIQQVVKLVEGYSYCIKYTTKVYILITVYIT